MSAVVEHVSDQDWKFGFSVAVLELTSSVLCTCVFDHKNSHAATWKNMENTVVSWAKRGREKPFTPAWLWKTSPHFLPKSFFTPYHGQYVVVSRHRGLNKDYNGKCFPQCFSWTGLQLAKRRQWPGEKVLEQMSLTCGCCVSTTWFPCAPFPLYGTYSCCLNSLSSILHWKIFGHLSVKRDYFHFKLGQVSKQAERMLQDDVRHWSAMRIVDVSTTFFVNIWLY